MFSEDWKSLGIPTSMAYGGEGPSFAVHSLHLTSRVGPDGGKSNQIIVSLTQQAKIRIETNKKGETVVVPDETDKGFTITGGCTLIFDLDTTDLKYAISKPLLDIEELNKNVRQINLARSLVLHKYQQGEIGAQTRFQAYFGTGKQNSFNEPFHFLHTQ